MPASRPTASRQDGRERQLLRHCIAKHRRALITRYNKAQDAAWVERLHAATADDLIDFRWNDRDELPAEKRDCLNTVACRIFAYPDVQAAWQEFFSAALAKKKAPPPPPSPPREAKQTRSSSVRQPARGFKFQAKGPLTDPPPGPLHPSWEARRRYKQLSRANRPFEGKRLIFRKHNGELTAFVPKQDRIITELRAMGRYVRPTGPCVN